MTFEEWLNLYESHVIYTLGVMNYFLNFFEKFNLKDFMDKLSIPGLRNIADPSYVKNYMINNSYYLRDYLVCREFGLLTKKEILFRLEILIEYCDSAFQDLFEVKGVKIHDIRRDKDFITELYKKTVGYILERANFTSEMT